MDASFENAQFNARFNGSVSDHALRLGNRPFESRHSEHSYGQQAATNDTVCLTAG